MMNPLEERLSDLEGRVRVLESEKRSSQVRIPVPPAPHHPSPLAATPPPQMLESAIGQWWIGIAGVVVLLFGVSFFLKYAFDHDLISEGMRVVMGLAAGFVLIILGELLRPRLSRYSFILSGAGLALLYLSLYAGYAYYDLISLNLAFFLMMLTTAIGVGLSLWTKSPELAAIAFSGGFITPFLLASPVPHHGVYFGYLIVLSLAIAVVSMKKGWQPLLLFGLLWSVANLVGWYGEYYAEALLSFTLLVSTVLFIIYQVATAVSTMLHEPDSRRVDLYALPLNAAWFFLFGYAILNPDFEPTLGFFALVLGVFHGALLYAVYLGKRDDEPMRSLLTSLTVAFFVATIPLQFDGSIITVGWSAGVVILALLGFQVRSAIVRFSAYALLLLTVWRLVAFDRLGSLDAFLPLVNERFLAYLSVAAAAACVAWLASEKPEQLNEEEKSVRSVSWFLALALLLAALTLDVNSFFEAKIEAVPVLDRRPTMWRGNYSANYSDVNQAVVSSLRNQMNAVISVLWTLYAVFLMGVGIVRQRAYIRWGALGLFGITVFKVFLVDLARLETISRIISFIVLGIVLLLTSYLYFRYQHVLEGKEEGRV